MHIETPKKTINKSSQEVYDFLTDVKNFEHLMPENISKFEVINEDRFLFALKGMPEIVLQRKEMIPTSKVVLGAASEKLPFTLTANIIELGARESEVVLSFEGEFNAMMAMMIKNPITNFMGTLSDNLHKV
tara:strand:+ start:25746 stop:26138 length:393 start_codon:yes stop_codon:yes gene_type:complete